jgi:hypothetical protein
LSNALFVKYPERGGKQCLSPDLNFSFSVGNHALLVSIQSVALVVDRITSTQHKVFTPGPVAINVGRILKGSQSRPIRIGFEDKLFPIFLGTLVGPKKMFRVDRFE